MTVLYVDCYSYCKNYFGKNATEDIILKRKVLPAKILFDSIQI